MLNITMKTQDALELVHTHQDNHQREYALQMEGWRKQMEEYSREMQEWTGAQAPSRRPIEPTRPLSYEKTYTRLSALLIEHCEGTISLNSTQADMIVNDKFSWRHNFVNQSTTYGGTLSADDDD